MSDVRSVDWFGCEHAAVSGSRARFRPAERR